MLRRFAVVFLWFLITPATIFLLIVLSSQRAELYTLSQNKPIATEGLAQENIVNGQVLGVEVSDLRPYYVANFLKNTRLEPYSHYMVEVSDKYGLDYRLIPAIAMRESTGGNAVKEASHNAWGFENGRTNFSSWEQAIEIVGKTLKERYADKGLVTPEQIMPVYAPPQIHKGGKWARDIRYFYSKLENL